MSRFMGAAFALAAFLYAVGEHQHRAHPDYTPALILLLFALIFVRAPR